MGYCFVLVLVLSGEGDYESSSRLRGRLMMSNWPDRVGGGGFLSLPSLESVERGKSKSQIV